MDNETMLELPSGMTDQMWWKMCDFHVSLPVPLAQADLAKPFVYERKWGVFYVPMGCHQHAMSLLLAFQRGTTSCSDAQAWIGLKDTFEAADYWLENTPGAAFRSSVGGGIQVGSFKGLTPQERRSFSGANQIF